MSVFTEIVNFYFEVLSLCSVFGMFLKPQISLKGHKEKHYHEGMEKMCMLPPHRRFLSRRRGSVRTRVLN